MNHAAIAYELWSLVIINSGIFIIFAFSFFKPRTPQDWKTFGTFSAIIVALGAQRRCINCLFRKARLDAEFLFF